MILDIASISLFLAPIIKFWNSDNDISSLVPLGLFMLTASQVFISIANKHLFLKKSCKYYREEVTEFFSRMDRDFDGRLSFEEFMGEETTLEKLFKNMDKNNDGVVTKQVRVKLSSISLRLKSFKDNKGFKTSKLFVISGVHDYLHQPL